MVIDWEHHYAPPSLRPVRGLALGQKTREFKDGKPALTVRDTGGIEKHLEWMDGAGIDIAVLSAPGERSLEEAKLYNQAMAEVARKYPGRFLGLASVSPLGGEEALRDMAEAIRGLGLRGVAISAQVGGHNLDSPALWPFYERVAQLGVPIFVHSPGVAWGFDALDAPYDLNRSLVREFTQAAAAARLCLGGVLESFPDLKLVISHFGGGIAALKDRIEGHLAIWEKEYWYRGEPPTTKPFQYYFEKLYFDMAGYGGAMGPVRCALTAIRPQRLVFATDYPPWFFEEPQEAKKYIRDIRGLDLDKEAIEGILGGNAAALLGL